MVNQTTREALTIELIKKTPPQERVILRRFPGQRGVSITAAQVDEALVKMRQQGRTLRYNVPFTALRYWWDAEAATFMEHSRFEHPYSDKDRESTGPISAEQMREILEGVSHKTLKQRLYP